MPINYSVIINQEEKARFGAFIDANAGRGVRAVSRDLEKQLSNIFPLGTVTYADGSKHSIQEYSEMLIATTVIDAERQATLEFIRNNPTDLVQVSIEGSSHVECAIWEGEILSVSGADPNFRSLDEAMGVGLFHPRCAHSIFPVYNDEFVSDKAMRERNMETIIGNYLRASRFEASEAGVVAFFGEAERALSDRFDATFKAKRVGDDFEVGAAIKLKATGELIKAKPTRLAFGQEIEDELQPFYVSPFKKGKR